MPDLAAIRPYEHMFEATAWPRVLEWAQFPPSVTYFRFYAVWSIDDCTDYAGVHASVGRRAYDAIVQLASSFDRIAWRSADTLLAATQRYHNEAQNHHSRIFSLGSEASRALRT